MQLGPAPLEHRLVVAGHVLKACAYQEIETLLKLDELVGGTLMRIYQRGVAWPSPERFHSGVSSIGVGSLSFSDVLLKSAVGFFYHILGQGFPA